MSAVEEHRYVGAAQRLEKISDLPVHGRLGEVEATHDLEAEASQPLRHILRVVARVLQRSGVLVGRVANDERDAPLSGSRQALQAREDNQQHGIPDNLQCAKNWSAP